MPATEYFGFVVTNVGPLTTTFSPAPACATASSNLVVQEADFEGHYWREQCKFPSLEPSCVPSASKLDELYNSYYSGDLGAQGWLPYYSPASICPSGWSTVAVAASSSGADSLSTSGVFTTPPAPTGDFFDDDTMARPPSWHDVYMSIVEEGETLIWCCPSGHTADARGICASTVGPLNTEDFGQFTTVCNYGPSDISEVTVSTMDGTALTPPLISFGNDLTDYETYKETLVPSVTSSEYNVIHSLNAMALIHSEDDDDGGDDDGDGNDSSDDNNDDGGGGSDNDDDDDAAPSARSLSLVSFAAVGLGLLAGMGVLMPW